ncbi:MAG: transposase [Leptotrichiaceae bacterium]|nr:transposase [Leptotrichiaceae bacterium]
MAGSTGKRYGEEFKLMILEMHKKGKTIRELSSEYKISPHTISYWKNQKKREMKVKYKNDTVKYDEIQSLKIELSEKEKQIKDQAEEIEILKKVYAILMKK